MIFRTEPKAAPAAVLKHMAYPTGKTPPERVMDRLSQLLNEMPDRLRPVVYYAEFPISPSTSVAALEAPGSDVVLQLPLTGCESAIVAVATVEKASIAKEEMPPMASDQLLLQAIENAALESVVEDFWNHMASQARQTEPTGLTRIYLPGEIPWPLTSQAALFSLLKDQEPRLSVVLNEHFMMIPERSLSFVIGRTEDGSFSEAHHDCSLCALESCAYRKRPSAQHQLIVHDLSGTREFYVEHGVNLLSAVIEQGYKVESTCGGNKTCGKCRVTLAQGCGPEPSAAEQALRQKHNLAADERLLCYLTADRDLEITLSHQHLAPQIAVEGHIKIRLEREPWVKSVTISRSSLDTTDQRGMIDALLTSSNAEMISHSAMVKASGMLASTYRAVVATVLDSAVVEIDETASEEDTDGSGNVSGCYGIALDIGTTTLAAYLYDEVRDEVVATASALNPQFVRGRDVMTRLHYVAVHEHGAVELSRLLSDEINALIESLAGQAGVDRRQIYHIVTTGNTTMQQLLLGVQCGSMGVAPFTPVLTGTLHLPASSLKLEIHEDGRLTVLPSRTAFIGADTVAAVYASGIHRQKTKKAVLLIDIGTNGEIVLAGNGRMLCCSTAAGPAFEGGSISCGMGGVWGAIDKVNFNWPHVFTTLGGALPLGICGSGLVDLTAELLRSGKLSRPGRLLDRDDHDRFYLDEASGIFVSQKDIRELQLAKGAIHAAVEILMGQLGITADEIERVYLAGGFGSFLNLESAEEIKLLPAGLMTRAVAIGNAAGMGAVAALRSKSVLREMEEIKTRMEYVELSGSAQFQQAFIMKMGF